jgi:hypothetical protein
MNSNAQSLGCFVKYYLCTIMIVNLGTELVNATKQSLWNKGSKILD